MVMPEMAVLAVPMGAAAAAVLVRLAVVVAQEVLAVLAALKFTHGKDIYETRSY